MSVLSKARLRRDPGVLAQLAGVIATASAADAGHRLVWTLFPRAPDQPRDFLFRALDDTSFLVLSARLPEDPLGLWDLDTKPYAPNLQTGQELHFALRANPTVSRRGEARGRGRRVAATGSRQASGPADGFDAPALAWLSRRADTLGVVFEPDACHASQPRTIRIPRPDAAAITFVQVDFEGRLRVADPDRLLRAALAGVGPAKAFGCGLLLLRPAG